MSYEDTIRMMEEGRIPRNTLPVVFDVEVPTRTPEEFFTELSRRVCTHNDTPAWGEYHVDSLPSRSLLTEEHDSLETSHCDASANTPAATPTPLTTGENRELVYSLSGVIGVLERMHDDFDRAIDALIRARDALELTPACTAEYEQVETARELLAVVNRLLTEKVNKQMAFLAMRLNRFA